jgi:hypothetical protein
MAKSNKIAERKENNPQSNLMKYQGRVFDKFLSDLFPIGKNTNNKDGDDPHYFI